MRDQGWDRHWEGYSPSRGDSFIFRERHRLLLEAVDLLQRAKNGLLHILEAGCGAGHNIFLLCRSLDRCLGVGLDVSPTALEKHRELYPDTGATMVLGDLYSIPFADASFDLVFNAGVIEHFANEEKGKVFAEQKRILRPEGLLFITVPGKYSLWWLYQRLRRKPSFGYEESYDLDDFSRILQDNGFSVIRRGGIDPFSLNSLCLRLCGVAPNLRRSVASAYTEVYFLCRLEEREHDAE